jgi:hypothetical protein
MEQNGDRAISLKELSPTSIPFGKKEHVAMLDSPIPPSNSMKKPSFLEYRWLRIFAAFNLTWFAGTFLIVHMLMLPSINDPPCYDELKDRYIYVPWWSTAQIACLLSFFLLAASIIILMTIAMKAEDIRIQNILKSKFLLAWIVFAMTVLASFALWIFLFISISSPIALPYCGG